MALTAASLFPSITRRLARDPLPRALLDARITHVRFSPRRYKLSHRLVYIHIPLDALERVPRLFLAHNKRSLYALFDRDYGCGGDDIRTWIRDVLKSASAGLPEALSISLVTVPRVLGFAFNPVSFWFCRDRSGLLRAVVAEVNNTFGERHCYLCCKADASAIAPNDEITAEKVFHVSPFLPVDGIYKFRFSETDIALSITIDLIRNGERVLAASIAGPLKPLTSGALLSAFIRHPVPGLQILLLIHYHALRLYLAGHKFFAKPAPPPDLISAGTPRPRNHTETELR